MSADALSQKEKQLQLILALDSARDRLQDDGDPHAMFHAIVQILKDHFEAEASGVLLLNENTQDVDFVIAVGAPEDLALGLCRQALLLKTPSQLSSTRWKYALGFQVLLDEHSAAMGSLFIARKNDPFADGTAELLLMAESQIDSAVIQARMIWKLANRNRELQVIFEIDRLRDNARDENDLVSSFTAVVQDHFRAELAMVILSGAEGGDLAVRGLVDRHDLSTAALETIRNVTRDLQSPQLIPSPTGIENLILLAAPLIVSGERFGAIVVGRSEPFTVEDHRLMYAVMSQMDSAILHSRTFHQLALRKRELEIIYNIDHIRDKVADFDTMLLSVLAELCHAISSEMGYLMLYNAEQEEPLELKATTVSNVLTEPDVLNIIKKSSREALDAGRLTFNNNLSGAIRSIVSIPLILNERIIGVFGAINSDKVTGFTEDDRRMLTAITSQVDTAVFERLERRRMREVLARSVDPKVLEALLQKADDNVLGGERVVISILFADLRGSTEWAERTDPEELVNTLNRFLGAMTDVIFNNGGTLDKFVGDEVIALFGTPVDMEDHAYHAAKTALEMQAVHKQLQAEIAAQGKELPAMGVGVSTGEVIAGEFGPPIRTDFTAMGRVMNLGARLCSAAEGGQIIISENTRHALGNRIQVNPLQAITPKGIARPVQIFELLSIEIVPGK